MNKLLSKNFIIGVIFISIALMFTLIFFSRYFINSDDKLQILTDTPEKTVSLFFNYARKGDEKHLKRLLIETPHQYYIECPEIISTKNYSNQSEEIKIPDLPLSNEPTGESKHKASIYRRIKAFINPEPFENPISEEKYYMNTQIFSEIELLWQKARVIYIQANSKIKYKIIDSNITNDEARIKIEDNLLNYQEYYYLKKVGEEWKIFAWEPESLIYKNRFIYGKPRNCSNK